MLIPLPFKHMKFRFIGGAGFLGCIVGERLIAAGGSVAVFGNRSLVNRDAAHPAATLLQGDR